MKTRKRQKKTRLRLLRKARLDAALDARIGSIQSTLETIQKQLGGLATLSKGVENLDTYTKEKLAAKARENLRIESLKKLFSLSYGNFRYVSETTVDENIGDTLASLRRRMAFLKNSIEKILNDESVRVIAPAPNDPFSSSEHCIIKTVVSSEPECQPGHVAECLSIGFAVRGVVTPAEVTVFADNNQSQNKTDN